MDAETHETPEYVPEPFVPEPDVMAESPADPYEWDKHDWSGFVEKGRPGSVDPEPVSFESAPDPEPESDESDDFDEEVGNGIHDDQISQERSDGHSLDELVGTYGPRVYRELGIPDPNQAPPPPLFTTQLPEIDLSTPVDPEKLKIASIAGGDPVTPTQIPEPLDDCFAVFKIQVPEAEHGTRKRCLEAIEDLAEAVEIAVAEIDVKASRKRTLLQVVLPLAIKRAWFATPESDRRYVQCVRDHGLDDVRRLAGACLTTIKNIHTLTGVDDAILCAALRAVAKKDRKS